MDRLDEAQKRKQIIRRKRREPAPAPATALKSLDRCSSGISTREKKIKQTA
jgi:hypothetical protein